MHSFLQVDRITQQRHALNLDLIHTDVVDCSSTWSNLARVFSIISAQNGVWTVLSFEYAFQLTDDCMRAARPSGSEFESSGYGAHKIGLLLLSTRE
jgi:hypothetical protein